MAINTALQNQTCFNKQERSVRSTSIDCSGPRYCLLNAGMNLNELQLIVAGRVTVCLTQDPRAVLDWAGMCGELEGPMALLISSIEAF